MKYLLASILLSTIAVSAPSFAECNGYSAPVSQSDIRSSHQTFLDLIAATPEKQREAYENVRNIFSSVEALLDYARHYVSFPLDERLRLEREYARWYRSCVAARDARRSQPRYNFPNRATCYREENCQGMTNPAPWGPIGCPSDYQSYRYDSDNICRSI